MAELIEKEVRLVHIGRKDRIAEELAWTLAEVEQATEGNIGQTVILAIDFGSNDHDTRIGQRMSDMSYARALENKAPLIVTDELKEILRDGGGIVPPADLVFRTKEQRLSGLYWPTGPETELYLLPEKMFPQVQVSDIVDSLVEFSKRKRNLGA